MAMSSSTINISIDIIMTVGYKDNIFIRGIYGFTKYP